MIKWNITNLLMNDSDFDYTLQGVDSNDDVVTLVSDADFRNSIIQEYFSFCILNPVYFDTETERYVEIITDRNSAINYLHQIFNIWRKSRTKGFIKLYEALRGEYDPISNYDKHSTIRTTYSGKETNTNTPTGTETDTLTKTGKETNTNTPSGSESTTLDYSGTETDTLNKTGSEAISHNNAQNVVTTSKTPYDTATFFDSEKQITNQKTDTDTTSFNNRSDENVKTFSNRKDTETTTFTNRKTEDELSFTNRQDTNVKSFTDRKTIDEKTFTDRYDEVVDRTYGNIGVTTSQQMIESQFPLTEKDNMIAYIVNLFVHENLVL